MLDAVNWADTVWRAGLVVDPAMSVSEWADRHRVLSSLSAEPGGRGALSERLTSGRSWMRSGRTIRTRRSS